MTIRFRARWDGKVFIPEEPVDLPVDEPLELEVTVVKPHEEAADFECRRAALRRIAAEAVHGVNIPLEALRRENMYEDRP